MSTPTHQAAPVSARREDAEPKAQSLARIVLCVDDDPDYLEIVRRSVAAPGVDTVGAASAEQALELIERQRIDAIVTDLNLPEQSGIELIQTLRGAGNNVRVLALGGGGWVTAAVEAQKQGAAASLKKPTDGQRLRGLVGGLLLNGPAVSSGSEVVAPP